MDQSVNDQKNVAIRIRPQLSTDLNFKNCIQCLDKSPPVLLIADKQYKNFSFDKVFLENVDQDQVYESMIRPLINQVLQGRNCVVFAYGHTGTGKSYTMGTDYMAHNEEKGGIISRALRDFFISKAEGHQSRQLFISYYELYNNKVYDLLTPNEDELQVKGFKICELSSREVHSQKEAEDYLIIGNKNRHIARTNLNINSSRSHAIFVMQHKVIDRNGMERISKLNLVDLAGSESAKRTGNIGSKFKEGVCINQGLFAIGKVVNALGRGSYVPYRDSMITTILQDSLNVRTHIAVIACISPNIEHVNDTIQTLDFAQKIKKVRSEVDLNQIADEYKRENSILDEVINRSCNETPFKKPKVSGNIMNGGPVHSTPFPFRNILPTPAQNIARRGDVDAFSMIDNLTTLVSSQRQILSTQSHKLEEITQSLNNLKVQAKIRKNKLEKKIVDTIQKELEAYKKTPKERIKNRILEKCRTLYDSYNISVENNTMQANENSQPTLENITAISPIFKLRENSTRPRRNISFNNTNKSGTPSLKTRLCEDQQIANSENDTFKVPALPKMNKSNHKKRKREEELIPARRSIRILERSVRIQEQSSIIPDVSSNTTKRQTKPNKKPAIVNKRMIKARTLDVLNSGGAKDMQNLHTVGPKLANQLLLFRQIHGKFKTIDDLKSFPWRGKGFERFATCNLLD